MKKKREANLAASGENFAEAAIIANAPNGKGKLVKTSYETDKGILAIKGVWKNLIRSSTRNTHCSLLEKPEILTQFARKLDQSGKNAREKGNIMSDYIFKNAILKQKPYKPPKKKNNHDKLQYELKAFPWSEIWRKADASDDTVPNGFETSGSAHTVKITEGTELTNEICKLFLGESLDQHDTDLWKFVATIKLIPGTPFLPVLGKLQQYRNVIQLGTDFVHTRVSSR